MPLRRPAAAFLIALAWLVPWREAAALEIGALPAVEFRPASAESAKIPVRLTRAGEVFVDLFTGDGDRVRTLASDGPLPPGEHVLVWDGRDESGEVVPDEAYHIVLRCRCGPGEEGRSDPRQSSGGQSLGSIRPELGADGGITFDLKAPARVMVRVGARGGAMMRSLEVWRPRAPGRVRVQWDGMDASGVESLLGSEGLTVMVAAFALPDATLLTSGNRKRDYAAYRKARGWAWPQARQEDIRLERNGVRLMRQSQLPISSLRDPRASLAIVEKLPRRADGMPVIRGPVTFRADMAAEDKWALEQTLYEVSFFLDRQFVSEEETGFTPLSWRWDPAGVSPGPHTMTVNISGFAGHVGVASVRFWVEAPAGGGSQPRGATK
jgi:hypothetical protein